MILIFSLAKDLTYTFQLMGLTLTIYNFLGFFPEEQILDWIQVVIHLISICSEVCLIVHEWAKRLIGQFN